MALLRIDPGLMLWLWILFGLVVLILRLTVWKRITGGLDARGARIRVDLAAARETREQADKSLEEARKQVEASRREAALIIEQARYQAASLRERLVKETETALEAQRKKALEQLGRARAEAVREVQEEVLALSLSMARAILQREVGPADEKALADEFLRHLPAQDRPR